MLFILVLYLVLISCFTVFFFTKYHVVVFILFLLVPVSLITAGVFIAFGVVGLLSLYWSNLFAYSIACSLLLSNKTLIATIYAVLCSLVTLYLYNTLLI